MHFGCQICDGRNARDSGPPKFPPPPPGRARRAVDRFDGDTERIQELLAARVLALESQSVLVIYLVRAR